MQICPACKGKGVVYLDYAGQHGPAQAIKRGQWLTCAECRGKGRVGDGRDAIASAAAFFTALRTLHPAINRILAISWYISLAAAVFVDFAPLILLLPIVATTCFAYLAEKYEPADFRAYDVALAVLGIGWFLFCLLFVAVLVNGPLLWW